MIYLDNCATTKMRDEVLKIMYSSMKQDFANPSSLHSLGLQSEKAMKKSRNIISNYLNVDSSEIYFTSGGTESNNIAVQSIVKRLSKKGTHIITTKIEHSSITNIMKDLEIQGFKITYIDVDSSGKIDLNDLKNSISEDTILVSLIHVNNEIGIIQDIKEIKRIIKLKNQNTILHLDGVQSFGKIDFSIKDLGIDTFSFSSHKIHGPKGVGALYINKNLNLNPIIFGGDQEKGLRSGTENLSGIIGFGKAVEIMGKKKKEEREQILDIKNYTIGALEREIEDVKINSSIKKNSSPYILNVSLRDTRGEVLLHYLEQDDIYISTSSACSSKATEQSNILKAIGLDDGEIEGAIRICFSYEINKEDIDRFIDKLKNAVVEVRKIIMR